MTKEQAIELCKQIWNASSIHGALRVLHPGIGTIDSCPLSQSYQTKQEQEWASLFRELAEALEPSMKRCASAFPTQPNQAFTVSKEGDSL